MRGTFRDARHAVRMLVGSPGFTAGALLALALGIGANTAIFSMVSAVMLRQMPFRDPDRLVWAWVVRPDNDRYPFSLPNLMDYREQNRTLSGLSGFASWSVNLTGIGEPERLQGLRISADLFQTLGVRAAVGRALAPEDDLPGAPRVVVLAHGLWQRRFGGGPGIVGRSLTINGESHRVVGVLPREFFFPIREAELATALQPDADPWRHDRGSTDFLRAVGRLGPGVDRAQAQADLTGIAGRLLRDHPVGNARKVGVRLVPLEDEIVGKVRPALWVLFGAVGLLLLIACGNLAGLLLARAASRHKELAIRVALGATRARLLRQLLTECVLLSVSGGLLGLLLASWSLRALVALAPADLPRAQEIGIDAGVLLFTLALSILTGLFFGLVPALNASRPDFVEALKGEGRSSTAGRGLSRARAALVVAEVALSLVLLVGAGLFLRTFVRLQAVDPGFDPGHLLAVRLSLPKNRYPTVDSVVTFHDRLLPKVSSLPGVASAAAVSLVPLSGLMAGADFSIEGRDLPPDALPMAQYRVAGPGYFRTMKIPLLAGREFSAGDRPAAPAVAIINRSMAERFWPGGDPIGSRLKVDDTNHGPRVVEVVGVVGDVKHFGLDGPATLDIYLSHLQIHPDNVAWLAHNQFWLLRTAGDPLALASAVRREVQSVDGDVAASSIKAMGQYVSSALAPRRFNLLLLAIFSGAGLVLAASGLYAVVAYSVTQRTREIGIRMALGASGRDILGLVLGQGVRLVLAGVGIGLFAALALARLVTGLLYGVGAADPPTLVTVPIVLGTVSLLASYLPARRAARVDPAITLRFE